MYNDVLILIAYIAALFVAWNIGANDASNPTDTAVGSGALSINKAILLFSIFAGIGAVLQGWMVMKTLGKGIIPVVGVGEALATVIAAGTWIILASLKGMPISTSQSITGAILGVGVGYALLGHIAFSDINWILVLKIVASWVTSPLISMIMAIGLYMYLSRKITKYTRTIDGRIRIDRIIRYLLIASLAFSAYSFGANDVGNATGVYYTITSRIMGGTELETRVFLALLGSIGIALGAFTLGRRVIITVAYKITRLDLVSGLAAELSNALTVWLFTTLPYMLIGYGMPISTSYASVSSIIGVGIARNKSLKDVNW